MRRLDKLSHRGLIQASTHLLHGIQVSTDAPDHKVGARTQAHRRITMDHERGAKIIHGFDELVLAIAFFTFRKQPPFRPRAIEGKVDELTWKFSLVLFELVDVGSEPQ